MADSVDVPSIQTLVIFQKFRANLCAVLTFKTKANDPFLLGLAAGMPEMQEAWWPAETSLP